MTWTDPDDTDETPGWTPRASLEGETSNSLDATTDDPDFDDFEASLDLLLEAGSRADDADFERQDDGINEKGA